MKSEDYPFVVHDNTGAYVNSYVTRESAEATLCQLNTNQGVYTNHSSPSAIFEIFKSPFTITFDPKGLLS
jgi:hypothetical protein